MPDAPGAPSDQVVVIGASAGGVEALRTVVAGLPPDLPAAVVVVLHVPRNSPGMLAGILDRAGPLPAAPAEHGSVLRPGAVHVAPPDHHVLVNDGRLVLSTGPTENGHRPAVDPLFRSAALARGPAATGVVLSGTRDDGAAGLVSLVEHGGTAVVQDPEDALFAAMPRHALELVPEALVLPSDQIAAALARLVRAGPLRADRTGRRAGPLVAQEAARDEVSIARTGQPSADEVHGARPSPFSCPQCHGVLFEVPGAPSPHMRCRIGHSWSPAGLEEEQASAVESALWTALRALEERAALLARLADGARGAGRHNSAALHASHAADVREQAARVRELLPRAVTTLLVAEEAVHEDGVGTARV